MSSPEKAAQVGRVSSSPAMERTRCRSTPALRPPSTTEDRSTEWRYATRSGSCRPFGPTRAVTSSSSSVRKTSMPTPTAKARSPWRVRSARSASETWTCSGSSNFRCPGFLPTGRRCTLATAGLLSTQPRVYHGAEDRHFNFNGIRGNLIARVHTENFSVYGARKAWLQLLREGVDVGRDRVARLMADLGLRGVTRGRTTARTTFPALVEDRALDLVQAGLQPLRPGPVVGGGRDLRPDHGGLLLRLVRHRRVQPQYRGVGRGRASLGRAHPGRPGDGGVDPVGGGAGGPGAPLRPGKPHYLAI